MWRIVAKPEVCMGCHLCEIWCAVAHSTSKDIIKAFLYEGQKPLPRLLVEESYPESFALQCRHCDEPECMFACISGALYKDRAGRVLHDESKCVACYSCIMACPYGAIRINPFTGKILKCDLCADLDFPLCVEKCPNNALEYVEIKTEAEEKLYEI
ncbi:MAG: 4Fe-4S ferredoxin [Candidatus Alkanophagales archaeon]|nr:MAG: 4Fe-4S ferredoxin [Candidatus Alkanophagales archaeon]